MSSPRKKGAGKPVTHRRILHIAVPIVISNATVPILGAVDTGVVGQLGDPVPIGAVGIGAIILTSIYWIFGFLRMGTVGLTSQAEGAGDAAEVSALLVREAVAAFLEKRDDQPADPEHIFLTADTLSLAMAKKDKREPQFLLRKKKR